MTPDRIRCLVREVAAVTDHVERLPQAMAVRCWWWCAVQEWGRA